MAKLVLLSEGLTGKSHDLKVDKTTIGRLEDNSFQISEGSVSSHHCEVLLRGKDVIVKDLNSTNGTFINGERVTTEAPLKPGQILRLGQIEMRLETGEPVPATKKQFDQTRVIGGVKLGDFEQGARPVFDKDSPFAKKSNKTAVIFITIGVVLAVIIVVFLFIAYSKLHG
jgi:pSer/pThr/pTyr-binding forkhead associated (FHA) protein